MTSATIGNSLVLQPNLNPANFARDPTALVIEEIDDIGNTIGSPDGVTVELRTRALPYRPMTFSGTQRNNTTFYPGNPEGTVQILGAAEEPTTIKGMWKDRFIRKPLASDTEATHDFSPAALRNNASVEDVLDLVRTVDAIRRKGHLVKVTWDEISRIGIVSKFTQTWHRREDCEWELEFTWIGQDDPQRTTRPIILDATGSISRFRALLNKVKTVSAFLNSIANKINTFVTQVESSIADAEQALSNVIDGVSNDIQAAQRVLGIFNFVQQTINDFMVNLDNQLIAILINFQLQAPNVALATITNERALRNNLIDMRLATLEILQLLGAQTRTPLSTSYTAKDGQDLRDVSFLFYGTTDRWQQLLTFNHLKDSRLTGGQVIFVPVTD